MQYELCAGGHLLRDLRAGHVPEAHRRYDGVRRGYLRHAGGGAGRDARSAADEGPRAVGDAVRQNPGGEIRARPRRGAFGVPYSASQGRDGGRNRTDAHLAGQEPPQHRSARISFRHRFAHAASSGAARDAAYGRYRVLRCLRDGPEEGAYQDHSFQGDGHRHRRRGECL